MRWRVNPRMATRYGARRPEPSVKPQRLVLDGASPLIQSYLYETADGFGAGNGVFFGPGIDAGKLAGRPLLASEDPACFWPASLFRFIRYCIGHGNVV